MNKCIGNTKIAPMRKKIAGAIKCCEQDPTHLVRPDILLQKFDVF